MLSAKNAKDLLQLCDLSQDARLNQVEFIEIQGRQILPCTNDPCRLQVTTYTYMYVEGLAQFRVVYA